MTNKNGSDTNLRCALRESLEQTPSKLQGVMRLIYPELSYAIVGAAMNVHYRLGPGQLEKTYERALAIELRNRSIAFERQVAFESYYCGEPVGEFVADLIVDGRIILELKAIEHVLPVHRQQVLSYLRATNLKLGMLINFNTASLVKGITRLVN
jgi:GxxExxY protein